MILLTKFQAKWIIFGCTTAKSYLAIMDSHPMFYVYLTQKFIDFIFWQHILIDFRQIFIFFFKF